MAFRKHLFLIPLSICLFFAPIFGQNTGKIAEKTKNWKTYEGYFKYWWDATNGKIWLQIDRFDKEFLYVNALPAGLGSNDIGLDRGQTGQTRIVFFQKIGKKILLTQPNYDYRAVTQDANEQRAVRESFAQSILWSFTADEDENGSVLVDATAFFLRDAHNVVNRLSSMKQGSYRLDEARSAIYLPNTRNFPKNSEFEAIITFVGGNDAGRYVQSVAPSVEALTVRMHHSFVELPDSDFKPRRYDIRSGYFATNYYDYASPISDPIEKMVIARHRLQKKDPTAAMSEPVKPIVYYLDNGTPEPIRSALLDGARWWNQAFEAAGYINAFRVEILPDSADPMDIRYNIINWVHRSTRGWSYGATVSDPRTGEIIKGQVTLGSLRVRQDYLIFAGLLSPYETGKKVPETMQKAALQRLRQLSAHEIGHTLGLMHNYAASVNNRASVMDYPHPSVFLNEKGEFDFSKVYTNEIGDWDKRAILYGYQDFGKNADENAELDKILAENTEKGFLFISDADARATDGMHPHAHLWDNGDDAITELNAVLKIREKALANFSENNVPLGTPLSRLEDALVPVYNYHRYQLEAVCKLVGGMDYSYSVRGDKQTLPKILPYETQKEALDAALNCLNPSILAIPEHILNIIPPRPPEYYNIGEVMPKRSGAVLDPLAAAEALVNYEMAFLLNPQRANRLTYFGARNKAKLNFDDLLEALIAKIWGKEVPNMTGLEREIAYQNQQICLSWIINLAQSEQANHRVKAGCELKLRKLSNLVNSRLARDISYTAGDISHNMTSERIEQYFKNREQGRPTAVPTYRELPPGAPIGCGNE